MSNSNRQMKDLIIMKEKGLAVQVCTTLEPEAAQVTLNHFHPCGTTTGWVFDPEQGVVDCAEHPGRKHMVFVA